MASLRAPAVDDAFTDAVLDIVRGIPVGRAMSYGDVAAALGSRASRRVGQIMAHHGSSVPWWRVIRADGRPPEGHEAAARDHYDAEGTPLRITASGYRVALGACRWVPWRDED